jgi:glyoxylase-like metal-dependent hydrolase (beta-lactamase superfamily II)
LRPLTVGRLAIRNVEESARTPLKFNEFLPDCTPEILASERSWLEPRFAELSRGHAYLSFHSYLIKTSHHTILVDTCIGNDKDRGGHPGFHMLRSTWLDNLAASGVSPEDVDFVMCTHMHADHIGWNTRLDNGVWVPTFPRARYVFARREYEHRHAAYQQQGTGAWYRSFYDSVLPVVQSGQALLVASDHALDDEVSLEAAPGHTPGNVLIHLRSMAAHAVLSGDVIHHPIQVVYPQWSSAFCEDRAGAAQFRRQFVERYANTDSVILPAHFCAPTAGHIRGRGQRHEFHFIAND